MKCASYVSLLLLPSVLFACRGPITGTETDPAPTEAFVSVLDSRTGKPFSGPLDFSVQPSSLRSWVVFRNETTIVVSGVGEWNAQLTVRSAGYGEVRVSLASDFTEVQSVELIHVGATTQDVTSLESFLETPIEELVAAGHLLGPIFVNSELGAVGCSTAHGSGQVQTMPGLAAVETDSVHESLKGRALEYASEYNTQLERVLGTCGLE